LKKLILTLLLISLLSVPCGGYAAEVPVRFSEGMVHGFLVLTDMKGKRLASGDFLQLRKGADIESRMLLVFRDGSLHDETAVFSQDKNFLLQSYRLIQKGPSFKNDMDITLERSGGKYTIKIRPRKDQDEKVLTGTLDLPLDVYNGMVPTVVKNLKGTKEAIHTVAFTPTPRIVDVEIVPSKQDRVLVGDLKKSALHYVLKPKLGIMLKGAAALLGRTPPDDHLWIIPADVPAFVRFEGPLYTDGPIWRVELASPVWPK
jgi:hypothetical protein